MVAILASPANGPVDLRSAANAVLIAHLAVIAFNVFGLVAIPLGGWLGCVMALGC